MYYLLFLVQELFLIFKVFVYELIFRDYNCQILKILYFQFYLLEIFCFQKHQEPFLYHQKVHVTLEEYHFSLSL